MVKLGKIILSAKCFYWVSVKILCKSLIINLKLFFLQIYLDISVNIRSFT